MKQAVKLANIRQDGGTQIRCEINAEKVAEYEEVLRDGGTFTDPIIVFDDGDTLWLADGFHRARAADGAGLLELEADIREGSKRDALLYACGANAAHGIPRTNADKRRAVTVLLGDPEWSRWSNIKIAKACAVDEKTVAAVRAIITPEIRSEPTKYVTKHGTIATMDTSRIGAPPEAKEAPTTKKSDPERAFTLAAWKRMKAAERFAACQASERVSKFNEQTTEAIDWAKWSWNPVTGCRHECPYCYARDITQRWTQAFPNGFEPTFLPDRLSAPALVKVPDAAALDVSYRNVFTCSMADLFGRWVPREWIEAILSTVREHAQWNFLFLTKFPKRYAEIEFPENAWVGTTVDCQARVAAAEEAMAEVKASVRWLSIEPMLEPLKFSNLAAFDWIVMGGASSSTKTPEWRVPASWWAPLHLEAEALGVRVYHKTNLYTRSLGFPGGDHGTSTAPDVFKYLKGRTLKDVELGEAD